MIAGPETNEIITLNLPSDGGFNFAILVKICLCFRCPFSSFSTFLPSVKHKKILSLIFSLFFTYPIMLFPVTSILEKKLEVRMEKYKIQSVLYTNTICILADCSRINRSQVHASHHCSSHRPYCIEGASNQYHHHHRNSHQYHHCNSDQPLCIKGASIAIITTIITTIIINIITASLCWKCHHCQNSHQA